MEYADGDIQHLFYCFIGENNKVFYSCLIQILIGLLCFQNKYKHYHRDFAFRNMVYKNVNKNLVLRYIINGQDFFIPTYGYLVLIIDFGSVTPINPHDHLNFDIFNKYNSLNSNLEKLIMKKIINKFSTSDFINIFLDKYKETIIELYDEDKTKYLKKIRECYKRWPEFSILKYDVVAKMGIDLINVNEIIQTCPNNVMGMIIELYKEINYKASETDLIQNFILNY